MSKKSLYCIKSGGSDHMLKYLAAQLELKFKLINMSLFNNSSTIMNGESDHILSFLLVALSQTVDIINRKTSG